MVVYCFSLCSHPAGTNEIASPLCRHSRRVRTRLLQVALLHSTGGRLARLVRLHSTRGQVAFLRLRSTGTPGGQAAIFRRPGGRSRVAFVAIWELFTLWGPWGPRDAVGTSHFAFGLVMVMLD